MRPQERIRTRQSNRWMVYRQYQGQMALGMLILILCVFVYLYYRGTSKIYVNWLAGVAIGIILDRSRLCFNAAFRDPILYGLTKTTKGVISALLVATIGFALIQHQEWLVNSYVPGNVRPIGWNLFIGAVIFGIGASIAGSCTSGTLMRMGEGFGMQWWVLIGIIFGSIHGIHDAPWWYRHFSFGKIRFHFPTRLGWVGGVGLQIIALIVIYLLVSWYEKWRFMKGDE